MKDKKKITMFSIYYYVLMFVILNKTFKPLGMDLRIICVILGALLIGFAVKGDKARVRLDNNMKKVFILYGFILVSMFNIRVEIRDYGDYVNLIVLNLYNLFNIIVLAIYRSYLNSNLCKKGLGASLLFLGASILLTTFGFELPYSSYYTVSVQDDFLGLNRYVGYGTDPNYVSMIYVCYIFIIHRFEKKKSKKVFWYVFSILMIGLSRSATIIILACMLAIISVVFKYMNVTIRKRFIGLIFICLIIIPILMVEYKPLNFSLSMSIRYNMWSRAIEGFSKHSILGNGLGAVRNISYDLAQGWYVQCHSTFFQILCEHGILALGIYLSIFYSLIQKNKNNNLVYLYLIYFIWSFTYETMYLAFPILFFGIFPYIDSEKKGMENKNETRT